MKRSLAIIAGFVPLLAGPAGFAQAPSASQAPAPGQPRAAMLLGFGDYMTFAVQPRHIKLAIAVRARDWSYASYEVHELQESWERFVRLYPKRIADQVTSTVEGPTRDLEAAIRIKDVRAFDIAYRKLTDGCNACHQADNKAAVVIKVPTTNASFADQQFRPDKD